MLIGKGDQPLAMDALSTRADLGVAICAQNSERTIGRTIQSVLPLARRVVVVDGGSTDGTVELCRSLGAEVIHQPWMGHVAQKQFAIDQCRDCKWILLLDSDESLEPALQQSIADVMAQDDPSISGWMLNRKIWFLGGWLHHTFQPEWRLRLFRSGCGRIAGVDPHDRVEVDGGGSRVAKLQGDLRHDSWLDLDDMARRHLRYAQISAKEATAGGSALSIFFSPPAAMFKQLILKRGFLDGWRGLVAAGMTAQYTILKHVYIAANRRLPRE